jgi:hypothetical protein
MAHVPLVNIIMEDQDDEVNDNTNEDIELTKAHRIEEALGEHADVNEVVDGITPLIALILNTNRDAVTFRFYIHLIPRLIGNDINFMGPRGSALHYSAFEEQGEYMDALLANGANVNLQNALGETALFIASAWSRYEFVIHLIDRGADVNILNNQGISPLDITGRNNNNLIDETWTLEELCNAGANGMRCQGVQVPMRLRARAIREERQLLNANAARQANAMDGAIRILQRPDIRIPDVSQGVKVVPEDKRTNMISYDDIVDGEDIIVITEPKGTNPNGTNPNGTNPNGTNPNGTNPNGAEFFYRLETIQNWFRQREQGGHSKTNPGSGSTVTNPNQVTRWTASITTSGGIRRKVRKSRVSKKTKRKTKRTKKTKRKTKRN